MIYHFEDSNICDVTSGMIIHGCNAQGVMGSGVAKQLRHKYPEIYDYYVEFIDNNVPPLGKVNFVAVTQNLIIANCITQKYYGRDGGKYVSYSALQNCFITVNECCKQESITEVHIPYLIGAGLGGGDPKYIMSLIKENITYPDINFHHL